MVHDASGGALPVEGHRHLANVGGSGKTALLWELADRASEAGFVVATPTIASDGMLERIVEKIQEDGERYVKQRRSHVAGESLGALGFSAGLEFSRDVQETKSFQFKLAQLARKLTERGHGILILADELQANSPEVRQRQCRRRLY